MLFLYYFPPKLISMDPVGRSFLACCIPGWTACSWLHLRIYYKVKTPVLCSIGNLNCSIGGIIYIYIYIYIYICMWAWTRGWQITASLICSVWPLYVKPYCCVVHRHCCCLVDRHYFFFFFFCRSLACTVC